MMRELFIIAVLLLLIPSAFAQTWDYCSSNETLTRIKKVYINVPERNISRTINMTETINCNYGCRNNECVQPPWIVYAIIFILVIIGSILYIAWTHRS